MYKRVLLKISGEQLAGKYPNGIDPELCSWLADEIKQSLAQNTQFVIMVGGGNFVRGAQLAGNGIKRVTADQMGMLGTIMNALALTDIFEAKGLPTRCVSSIFVEQVAESFSYRLAEKHLENGRVLICAGGVGLPYVTTDTAAAVLALQLSCEVILKATKVDGVYDQDPALHSDAKLFSSLSYQNAVEDGAIKVMDKAAISLAMENSIPIVIFDAMQPGQIAKAAAGETIGTRIN